MGTNISIYIYLGRSRTSLLEYKVTSSQNPGREASSRKMGDGLPAPPPCSLRCHSPMPSRLHCLVHSEFGEVFREKVSFKCHLAMLTTSSDTATIKVNSNCKLSFPSLPAIQIKSKKKPKSTYLKLKFIVIRVLFQFNII